MKHGTRAALFLIGALVYITSVEQEDELAGQFDGVLVSIAVILLILAVRHPVHDILAPRESAVRVLDSGGSSPDRVRAILRLDHPDGEPRVRPVPRRQIPRRRILRRRIRGPVGRSAKGWTVAYGLTTMRADQAVAHLGVRGICAVRVSDTRTVVHRVLLHAVPVVATPAAVITADNLELVPVVGTISTVAAWAALVFVAYLVIDVCMSRRDTTNPHFSVAGPFTVRLVGVDVEREHDAVELIGALRMVAALGMDEARALFRTIPSTVAERVTAAEANRYRTALESAGATVEVETV